MKKMIIIILFFWGSGFLITHYPQDYSGSFEFEGKLRHYDVYLPQDYHDSMPLVLNLHGYGWTIADHAKYTLMHEYADTAGFIVVYPAGSLADNGVSGWNAGLRNHPFGQQDTTSNDVGFLSTLIDTLDSRYDIDMNRVYCCGLSMGGEMTYRMAIEKGQLFSAYASVSGKLNDISANTSTPLGAWPILHFHGTADDVETYNGENDGNLWPVEKTINYWLDNNNCIYQADTILLPDIHPNDGSIVQKISYKNCSEKNDVVFFKIINGGHGWPGSTEGIYIAGKPNRDINASSIILNFFHGYDCPPTDIAYGKSFETSLKYIPPDGDTLKIKAKIVNPENHLVNVYITLDGDETDFRDSIQLFDDGLHGDSIASDNIFGGQKIIAGLAEDFFSIKLHVTDFDNSYTLHFPIQQYFTTAGPIKVDTFKVFQVNDSLVAIDDLILKNMGSVKPLGPIIANMSTLSECVNNITNASSAFGKIEPGETKKAFSTYGFVVNDCPEIIELELRILNGENYYWNDTIIVNNPLVNINLENQIPTHYTLNCNYPNPFNPSTKIIYSIPKQSQVTLKVFDVLGREVKTLVNKEQPSGNYEIGFDASALTSGIYFYRIQAGQFVESKKMVLMK